MCCGRNRQREPADAAIADYPSLGFLSTSCRRNCAGGLTDVVVLIDTGG